MERKKIERKKHNQKESYNSLLHKNGAWTFLSVNPPEFLEIIKEVIVFFSQVWGVIQHTSNPIITKHRMIYLGGWWTEGITTTSWGWCIEGYMLSTMSMLLNYIKSKIFTIFWYIAKFRWYVQKRCDGSIIATLNGALRFIKTKTQKIQNLYNDYTTSE